MNRYKYLKGGLYQCKLTQRFYHRPTINGSRTYRVLDVETKGLARAAIKKLSSDQFLFEHGMKKDPYGAEPATVGELIIGYKEAGCPMKDQQPRTGEQLDQTLSRLKMLEPFWKNRQADQVKPKDCKGYAHHRRKSIRKGFDGGRAIDMELGTLAGVFHWAVFEERMDVNPIESRTKERKKGQVRHCKDVMPESIEQVHSLARALFEDPRSQVLGWQLLLEALTGCRTSEILRLRWDAQTDAQAGFICGDHLWLQRSKKGIKPWVDITPELDEVLQALKQWRIARDHQGSPWFIPSYRKPEGPVDGDSLTHALKRITKLLGIERRITSHGLRAFFVTVRRSQHIPDGQIAYEIGDKSGASIIESTYGGIPDNWKGGPGLTFTTPEKPAWLVLALPSNLVQHPLAQMA